MQTSRINILFFDQAHNIMDVICNKLYKCQCYVWKIIIIIWLKIKNKYSDINECYNIYNCSEWFLLMI